MHMLVKLIFIMAAYQHNIARAGGVCGTPNLIPNTVPVPDLQYYIGDSIRIQCAEGYVRKAGTSNLIRCTEKDGSISWHSDLRLKCIADPKKPHVPSAETQRPHQHFTSSTTERTARRNTTVHGTSTATTATGHIALTTTNEVVTTKTRRTTSLPTLMCTTKEAESVTRTNEVTPSTSSSFTSREYMTTTTSPKSGSFTTTTGVNESVTTSTVSKGDDLGAFSSGYKSTVGGVTGIILLCLMAAVLLLWWRSRNRQTNRNKPDPNRIQLILTNSVTCTSYTSVPQSSAADKSTEDSESDKNQPQMGIAHGADT
ncbi:cell wall protein DAN4-like isoform X1 [Sinocyclocheilus rhinocerous]|uniref:cell wall protein DAN4-like isoform X1 n=1 Tax=Sinocyclocheilus rhinocerous TaxID=307959 RepID=UPI0007B9B766|nr:PREDICTED: cell wall protein DAN4-like isoform X1 [Sinocyclocheilus rhinocerous]